MENQIIGFFKSQIGKDSSLSPSPVARWLDGRLLEAEEGHLVTEYLITPAMTNPSGGLHGGVISLIMDELMGASVFSLNNEYLYTSVNLIVDFLRPARAGDKIIATADVYRKGRKIMNVECVLVNEAGKIVARGTSNLVRTEVKNKMR